MLRDSWVEAVWKRADLVGFLERSEGLHGDSAASRQMVQL